MKQRVIFHDNKFQVIPEGVEMPKKPKRPLSPASNQEWDEYTELSIQYTQAFHSQLIPIRDEDQGKVKKMCWGESKYVQDHIRFKDWRPIPDHVYEVDVKMEPECCHGCNGTYAGADCLSYITGYKKAQCKHIQYRLIEQEKEQKESMDDGYERMLSEENSAHSFTEEGALYFVDSQINSIDVDRGNFEYIAKTGIINGNLLVKLRKIFTINYDRIASLEAELKEKDETITRISENFANLMIKFGEKASELNEARKEIERLKSLTHPSSPS